MTDKQMIITVLKLWFRPGDVFEIRVLDAITAEYMRPHVESGYFDFEHILHAADALEKLRLYRGAYATVNPVNPDLLGRAFNRLRAVGREPTTSDADILSRRWLLIDCDARRPAGISSSDAEHEAALAKAKEISAGLASLGWPEPVMTDSGNGAQLMYRIELPADDGGLIQKCLDSIALASSDQVEVDTTVHNPARIWRIPGTMNCKGDSIPARPHRMAKLLFAPKTLTTVTEEQLHRIAGESPSAASPVSDAPHSISAEFDLDAWIRRYCPELGAPQVWKDGRKWVFPVCPFNDAHRNHSAVLIQQANGAISFKCHHNGCAGNDWRKLRELREPGCYERKAEAAAPVDLTGILNRKPAAVTDSDETREMDMISEIPFPEDLFNVPGFVSDVMEFDLATAPAPNPALAFAGALALQAHLAARKIEAPGGARTNPYIIMLAKSGYGKDHPRKINKTILCKVGLGNEVIDNVASGQGLEDRLLLSPALLWQSDEFYAVLQEVTNDKTGQKENLMKALLSYFTSANMQVETRAKAGRDPATISCPNLTLLASCTPGGFYGSLNDMVLGHGMYSRMSLFHASKLEDPELPGDINNVPEKILRKAKAWADYRPIGSGNMDIKARVVEASPATFRLMAEIQKETRRELVALDNANADDWKLAIWTRAFESILRYALIYACSTAASPEDVKLSEEPILWAKKLIWWEAKNKIAMTDKHYFRSDFERYAEDVIDILSHWHRLNPAEPMPGWQFNRKTKKLPPRVLDAVIQSLTLQDRITVNRINNNGKSGLTYELRRQPCGKESTIFSC